MFGHVFESPYVKIITCSYNPGAVQRYRRPFIVPCVMYGMREERLIRKDKEIIMPWCSELGVDGEGAMNVYKEAIAKGMLGPRRAPIVIAACIYIYARRNDIPITIQELVKCTGESKAILERTIRSVGGSLPYQDPLIFIRKGLKRLNLPINTPCQAELDRVRNDLGVPIRAAIILFLIAHRENHSVKIRDAAGAVGVATETLRKYVIHDGTLKKTATGLVP